MTIKSYAVVIGSDLNTWLRANKLDAINIASSICIFCPTIAIIISVSKVVLSTNVDGVVGDI